MRAHALYLGAAAITLAGGAHGQVSGEPDRPGETVRFDTVIVSGLRPVPASDITGSLTVLTGADLAVRDVPYLADELRAVPGVGVSRSGAVGGLTQIRLRGAEANHTLLLIDGIEVSDPTSGESDFGLITGLRPARVEVLRGEQSGLYGSDAIGGVINVVTGAPDGVFARAEAGSFETWRAEAGHGFAARHGQLTVSGSGVSTGGVDSSGRGGEADGSQALSALANGRLDLGGGWALTGLARYGDHEVETDPDLDFDGVLDDADRVSESEHVTLGVALQGDAIGFDHVLRASFNAITRDNFADGRFTNASEGDRTKLSWSPSRAFGADRTRLRLTGLIDYEREDYRARDTQFGGLTNQQQSLETLGLAAEARLGLGPVELAASLRHDDNDGRFEDATTGRLGAALDSGAFGRLRASLGTGVKNPTFTELFGFFPGSFVGNPDLQPETSTSWEIGWDGRIGPAEASATWFQAELEDEIFTAFNPDFTATARNREGQSERSGLELGLRWPVTGALTLAAQATVIDSTSDDGSEEIRVPSQTASLSIDYRPAAWRGGRAGLAFDYVGEQDDFDFGAFPARRVTLDRYVLASASAEVPLSDALALTLRGENLFDETVTDVFGFNGPGAGVFIGLRVF